MINANELRVGNWVLNFNKPHKIRDGEDIDDAGRHKCFQPIPLTSEILKRAGFLKNYRWFKKKVGEFVYTTESSTMNFSIRRINDRYGITLIKITSVHQLQNIIFALTNKELMIQELEIKEEIATTMRVTVYKP